MNRNNINIAIVDDDALLLDSIAEYMSQFYKVLKYTNGRKLLSDIADLKIPDIILCDLKMPIIDGMSLLKIFKSQQISSTVIVMTAHGDIPIAVDAIQNGAYDFIEKPFHPENLKKIITQALVTHELKYENFVLKKHLENVSKFDELLTGQSEVMKKLRHRIFEIIETKNNIVLFGTSGVERNIIARAIHYHGPQKELPFVEVNCQIAHDKLFDSFFLGKDGAFQQTKNGGTIFFNRIDKIPIFERARLLDILQKFCSRSGHTDIKTRLIASTNQSLEQKEQNRMQQIYELLNAVTIDIPSLRERQNDIIELFYVYADQLSNKYMLPIPQLSDEDIQNLLLYEWHGNQQQLREIVKQFLLLSVKQKVSILYLLQTTTNEKVINKLYDRNLRDSMQYFEKQLIIQALIECSGNIDKTCKLLKIPRRTLNTKLLKYDLNRSNFIHCSGSH